MIYFCVSRHKLDNLLILQVIKYFKIIENNA